MLQNGGCNRKIAVLDLKEGDNIVLKFILEQNLYSLVRCTQILLFFVPRLYEKPQHVQIFF